VSAVRPERGVVAWFDDAAGVGAIADVDGHLVDFHCVSIADGSRRVAEGRPVSFLRRTGPTGRTEAVAVTPA